MKLYYVYKNKKKSDIKMYDIDDAYSRMVVSKKYN